MTSDDIARMSAAEHVTAAAKLEAQARWGRQSTFTTFEQTAGLRLEALVHLGFAQAKLGLAAAARVDGDVGSG